MAVAWSEEEQRLLEEGLLRSAGICDSREKWRAVAGLVGTRDARACAERYRVCRARALEARRQAEEAEQAEDEEEEGNVEGAAEGGDWLVREQATASASASSEAVNVNGVQEHWNTHWWSHGWHSDGGCGGHKGSSGSGWWEARSWNGSWKDRTHGEEADASTADVRQKQDEAWGWQGGHAWQEDGGNGAWASSSAIDGQQWRSVCDGGASVAEPEDLSAMDEGQRRALEMRREVEANRERLRARQEREEEERRRREKKRADEQEAREQQKRDHVESLNQSIQERQEQQRLKQQCEEEREREALSRAAAYNPLFAPARSAGGRVPKAKAGAWAAKAAAGQKGELARQRKQQALEMQAAEVFANIAASKADAGAAAASQPAAGLGEEAGAGTELASSSSTLGRGAAAQPIAPAAAPHPTAQRARLPASAAAAPPPKAGVPTEHRQPSKRRWWSKIDGDCPISLAPISELPQPPFALEAEGSSNKHYFDARFLASFLLSSCDFIDPVNRRPLTREECVALDAHLTQHHPGARSQASVADAFVLFQRHGSAGESPVHAVQREATAVLQHLFRFGSARRTDQRGRAVAYADAGLTVVDDDDILAAGAAQPAAAATPAEPSLERMTSLDFPQLAGGDAARAAQGGWASRAAQGRGGASAGRGGSFPALPSARPTAKPWGPSTAAAKAGRPSRGGKGRGGNKRGGGASGQLDSW